MSTGRLIFVSIFVHKKGLESFIVLRSLNRGSVCDLKLFRATFLLHSFSKFFSFCKLYINKLKVRLPAQQIYRSKLYLLLLWFGAWGWCGKTDLNPIQFGEGGALSVPFFSCTHIRCALVFKGFPHKIQPRGKLFGGTFLPNSVLFGRTVSSKSTLNLEKNLIQ